LVAARRYGRQFKIQGNSAWAADGCLHINWTLFAPNLGPTRLRDGAAAHPDNCQVFGLAAEIRWQFASLKGRPGPPVWFGISVSGCLVLIVFSLASVPCPKNGKVSGVDYDAPRIATKSNAEKRHNKNRDSQTSDFALAEIEALAVGGEQQPSRLDHFPTA